ncbi:MAG TPA: hypothetical protein VI111_09665 [Thermoleophilaceae bacterium]
MITIETTSRLRATLLLGATVATSFAFAASAGAATLKLHCAGKGPRNEDSAGTVLCAADPGHKRSVAGVVRNDAGQPVAAKLAVTYSSWIPAPNGIGYNVKPRTTREIVAKADGTFSFSSNTKTKESIRVDLAADPALGIAAGAFAQSEVSRRLTTKIKKLGGGRVKLTVKGTKLPLKLYVLSEDGYPLMGVKPKKAKHGSATFRLGSLRGKFSTYADAGDVYTDLFWGERRPTFRL